MLCIFYRIFSVPIYVASSLFFCWMSFRGPLVLAAALVMLSLLSFFQRKMRDSALHFLSCDLRGWDRMHSRPTWEGLMGRSYPFSIG